jgi:hypothetical protein
MGNNDDIQSPEDRSRTTLLCMSGIHHKMDNVQHNIHRMEYHFFNKWMCAVDYTK